MLMLLPRQLGCAQPQLLWLMPQAVPQKNPLAKPQLGGCGGKPQIGGGYQYYGR